MSHEIRQRLKAQMAEHLAPAVDHNGVSDAEHDARREQQARLLTNPTDES